MTETVQLHFQEQGSGSPVLLLHGFPFDHTIWSGQVVALSTAYRVIAPDLRGHGRSPGGGDAYPMEALAADVCALLDQLGIARAVWVGHSMGGYLTMAALRAFPERVAGVGLVATHPHADPPDKRLQRIQSAHKALAGEAAEILLGMMGVLFAPSLDRQSDVAQRVYTIMQGTKTEGIAGAQRGMADRPDSVETLKAARVPAVVIAGASDQIVAAEAARDMAMLMDDAPFHNISGAGHMPMVEQPTATSAALRAFLESLPAW